MIVLDDQGSRMSKKSEERQPKSSTDIKQDFIEQASALVTGTFAGVGIGVLVKDLQQSFVSHSRQAVYSEKPTRYPSAKPITPEEVDKVLSEATQEIREILQRRAINRQQHVELTDFTLEDLRELVAEVMPSALGFSMSIPSAWGGWRGGEVRRLR